MRSPYRPFIYLTTRYNIALKKIWGNLCVLCLVFRLCSDTSACSHSAPRGAALSTAGLQHIGIARYCLMLSSRCVHVFLFQWQSAMSMKCVPVLSTGKEGPLWCRDLNWSPLTLEDGLWTNTMPLTFAAVSLSACFWCLEAGCVFKVTKWIGETWIQFQLVFSFMKEKTDVFCFLSLTLK